MHFYLENESKYIPVQGHHNACLEQQMGGVLVFHDDNDVDDDEDVDVVGDQLEAEVS